jgi:hypothetical protein
MLLSDFIKTGNTRKTRTQARTQTRTQVRQQPRVQTRTQTREESRVQARTQARTQNRTQVPARAVSQQIKKAAERLHQLELDLAKAEKNYVQVNVESRLKVRLASSDAEAKRLRSKYALLIEQYKDLVQQARAGLVAFHKKEHPEQVYDYARKTWGDVFQETWGEPRPQGAQGWSRELR